MKDVVSPSQPGSAALHNLRSKNEGYFFSRKIINMIRYSSPPPFQGPSSLKTPATTGTENTKNKDAQDASPSFALPPADKKPGKSYPSLLQTQFKREEKKGLINTRILLSSLWFKAKGHLAEVERKAAENVMEYLSTKGKDSVLTPFQLQKKTKGILKGALRDMNSGLGQSIAKQNGMPGHLLDEFRASKKQAKIRIARSMADAFELAGWVLHRPEKSNVQWEPNRGPILVKCGRSLQQLHLTRADIAQGGFASVSIFENENHDKFIGKTPLPSKNKNSNPKDILAIELEAYKKIYDEVGPHPNLVNAYGIGQVLNNGQLIRTMLMDRVPGPTGGKTFDALLNCWDTYKITSEEYWGAVQFLCLRLLDVTRHLGKAGVAHNDIKPENFLVNENTGEPVVIDFGIWTGKFQKQRNGTDMYASPEARKYTFTDERSDVFTVGASILHGIERKMDGWPRAGLFERRKLLKDHEGNIMRQPGTYAVESAYTKSMAQMLKADKTERPDSKKAQKLYFIKHRMLDDDAAKEVIKKAISLAGEEEKKPEEERWKKTELKYNALDERAFSELHDQVKNEIKALKKALKTQPRPRSLSLLHAYARLQNIGKKYPELKTYLDGELSGEGWKIAKIVAYYAELAIKAAPWFTRAESVLKTMSNIPVKSGVDIDKHGVRHKTQRGIDPQQYADVVRARAALLSFVDKEALKIYVDGSSHDHGSGIKHFLDSAETLQGIYKQETNEKIKQVRERVMLARRMLDIFELGSSSIKNAGGRIIRKSHPTLDPIIRNHLRLSKEKERAHRLGGDAGEGSGSNTAGNQEDTSRKATLTRSKAMVGYGEDGPGSEEWQQIDEDLLSYLFDEPELTQNAS